MSAPFGEIIFRACDAASDIELAQWEARLAAAALLVRIRRSKQRQARCRRGRRHPFESN